MCYLVSCRLACGMYAMSALEGDIKTETDIDVALLTEGCFVKERAIGLWTSRFSDCKLCRESTVTVAVVGDHVGLPISDLRTLECVLLCSSRKFVRAEGSAVG